VRELAGCRLVRPLLAVPKARLKALLLAEGQLFVDDPSNRNPAFERARLRQPAAVASLCYPDPDPPPLPGDGRVGAIFSAIDNLLERTRACGTERVAREMVLGRLMAAAVSLHPAGFAVVDPSGFPSAAPELVERLFARVAGCVGVARYPVRRDRVARLRAGLMANPERPRTLGGCRFVPWRGRILVLRELAAAGPPTRLEPGRALLWDRRFAVGPAAPGSALRFGYLGPDAAPAGQNIDRLPCGLPRLVYPVLPALRDENGLVAVSHLGWRRDGYEGVLPGVSFRPLNPLARASFTVV
jgi:tRNA(Ile)-lysidine synthase